MTSFDFQIIGLILLAFLIGVVIGYLLRTRLYSVNRSANDARGVTLESRQERKSNALLRGKAGRSREPSRTPDSVPAETSDRADDEPGEVAPAMAFASEDTEASVSAPADSDDEPDNLQDIKGIGAVLEKQLKALGITRFEQIASWTEEDVARVNETLKFRGRIQRERWVEQARDFVQKKHERR